MKKLLTLTIAVVLALTMLSVSAFAGGGKVQGDKGTGTVVQNGPCPFGTDTPPQ